jgi:hypothetical protein
LLATVPPDPVHAARETIVNLSLVDLQPDALLKSVLGRQRVPLVSARRTGAEACKAVSRRPLGTRGELLRFRFGSHRCRLHQVLKSELDLVAPLWNPNLNDGVIINHAILWHVTPYTPWQKKCKECWDKLVKGDYDCAHLAFHLWPERVIPKCTNDRSLAIAHGLEERLWQETNNGNWLLRQLSEADLQALITEYSNPAVKSALDCFLAAPPPVAPSRTGASRSTRTSGSSAPRRPRGTAAVVDAEATRQVLLALTAAPSDGLAKAAIADLIGVETNALTAVIKQLKDSGQIDQLGERRGARYVLSEQGRAAVGQEEAG